MGEVVLLRGEQLVKTYDGGVQAVRAVDIELREGEVLGLLGPNGAGKTTLIRMLVGQLAPTGGSIELDGQPPDRTRTAAAVGVCPQHITLWKRLTALENIVYLATLHGLSREEAAERGRSLLKELQLSAKIDAQAKTLSGGMQRRLNLAMAIAHDPRIAVLDEPSPGLDPQTRALLWSFIAGLPARGHSVILTTHFMDEAERLCDRILIVDEGRVIASGTPRELLASQGEGDVVSVQVDDPQAALEFIDEGWGERRVVGQYTVEVSGFDLISRLPGLLEALDDAGHTPHGLSLRNNTLEDVFLHMTGRSLRGEGPT